MNPSQPFHRLAAGVAWWRHLLGAVLAGAVVVLAGLLLFVVVAVAAALAGRPDGADGVPSFGPRADLALIFVSVALLLPAIWLGARVVQGRGLGTLSSVIGRLRRRLVLLCLLPAAVAVIIVGSAVVWLDGPSGAFDGWPSFLLSAAVVGLVVPLQAAAEEYAFRGYLLQAFGSMFRRPWAPVALQAVLFAAVHGWGTPWGFADLVVFGLVAGWLTVRTGGLEAAIALHVVNNLAAGLTVAALGDLRVDETAADLPWQVVAVDAPVLVLYGLAAAWLIGRRTRTSTTPGQPALDALARA